jgi:hypothetical protein
LLLLAIVVKVTLSQFHWLPVANDRLPVWKNTKLFLKNAEALPYQTDISQTACFNHQIGQLPEG